MSVEQWVDINGYEGRYQVSTLGNIRSLTRKITYIDGRVATFKGVNMASCRGANGYRYVALGSKRMLIHSIVANAFLGPKPDWAQCINHIDGDKLNNRPSNLSWSTYKENNNHARSTGLCNQHGERCNLTKYSDEVINAIRHVHKKYSPTYKEMSDMFDIPASTISGIIRNLSRKKPTSHVSEDA